MKVKVEGVKEAQRGLEDFIYRHRRNAVKALVEVAEFATKLAVTKTPHYSGIAATSWAMDLKPIQANVASGTRSLLYPEGMLEPSVSDGSEGALLAQLAVSYLMPKVLSIANSKTALGEDLTIYVGNRASYAQLWLDPNNTSFSPRDVNVGFYTYLDILTSAKTESKSIVELIKRSA